MRRDSIFYALFNGSPSLLLDLLEEVPDSADRYRFESVVVKEPTFTIAEQRSGASDLPERVGGDRDLAFGCGGDGADNS
jgi:predicted transposase YdaD